MTFKFLTLDTGCRFHCRDDAERAVETFAHHYPAGYLYEVVEGADGHFGVRAYGKDGVFVGFSRAPGGAHE